MTSFSSVGYIDWHDIDREFILMRARKVNPPLLTIMSIHTHTALYNSH